MITEEERRLRSALRDLVEQVELLEDVTYSRDTEPYKAEACWDDALRRAKAALDE